MENTKIIELLTKVLTQLDKLVTKIDDNGLLSMTRIARERAESLEKYRYDYARQNGQPYSSDTQMDVNLPTNMTHSQDVYCTSYAQEGYACGVCECGCDGKDEID
jgi:hypothetical protein